MRLLVGLTDQTMSPQVLYRKKLSVFKLNSQHLVCSSPIKMSGSEET